MEGDGIPAQVDDNSEEYDSDGSDALKPQHPGVVESEEDSMPELAGSDSEDSESEGDSDGMECDEKDEDDMPGLMESDSDASESNVGGLCSGDRGASGTHTCANCKDESDSDAAPGLVDHSSDESDSSMPGLHDSDSEGMDCDEDGMPGLLNSDSDASESSMPELCGSDSEAGECNCGRCAAMTTHMCYECEHTVRVDEHGSCEECGGDFVEFLGVFAASGSVWKIELYVLY